MELSTILSHSAQLLKIINKSPKPSDSLASEYFRSKKYIGSKERRFISETVFFTLRNLTLCNFCFKNSKDKSNIGFSDDITNPDEFGAITAALLLSYNFRLDLKLSTETLIKNLPMYGQKDIMEEINKAASAYFNIDGIQVEFLLNEILEVYKRMEMEISGLLKESEISDSLTITLEIRYSIKKWIIKALHKYLTKDMLIELLNSITQSAPFIIRVNLFAIERDNTIEMLNSQNIEATACKISPSGVMLSKRVPIDQSVIYKTGLIEIQDEGSQLISYALAPSEGSCILDACAGAGGKSLHMASLTNDNSEITALDIDSRKLNELGRRAKRFGFKSINTMWVNPKKFSDSVKNNKLITNKKFEYVLVDAPCSGTGTIRRSPMQKYKLSPGLLERLQENQIRLLKYYSQYVAADGILVYASCSIMPQENQDVISAFMKEQNGFQPSPIKEVFNKSGILIDSLQDDDFYLNLLPSIHGTDGFFIARMKRIG